MQLGRYEVLEPIGRGASSTVFKARDTLIGRTVAIKTLQSGVDDPAWRERFMAEARIVGQLSHPRIVKLHDVGIDETSGAPYLVMEFVVGKTLEQHIAAGKTDFQQACTWGAALGRALACAHEQGIEGKMAFADKSFAEIFGVGNQQAPDEAGQFPIDPDQPFGGTYKRLSFGEVVGLPTLELSTDRLLGQKGMFVRQ